MFSRPQYTEKQDICTLPELDPDEAPSVGGVPAWSIAGLVDVLLLVLVLSSAVLLKNEC